MLRDMISEDRSLPADRTVICPVLVGRERALDAAHQLLDRARSGTGSVLLIAGEAGIGKSRLLRETVTTARELGFVTLRGACFEGDRTVPLAPLLDLVRELMATASASAVAHMLAPAGAELVRAFPELESVFSESAPIEALDPEQERRRLFRAVSEAIARLGRTQPVLLTIEDVHWSDEASLELFLHLARRISAQPVALVLSFRSDEVAPALERLLADLDRTRIAVDLRLRRFSASELSTMLEAIFDGAAPGGGFAETIYELTDGNPFFVEEVLKAMVSAGEVARRPDGAWQARPLARIQPPRTAVEAVRRRLSALTVPARDVASVAAVAGRRFDFTLLQALTGHDERALLALIRELISAQLVAEESPDRFAFRHALTREAILGELLARERSALHRLVADALLKLGGPPDAHIEALAYHAYGARDWTLALEASVRAANHALSLYAPREALAHLDRGLDAAIQSGVTPGAALRLARGRARETLGDLNGAHEEFSAALDVARANARDSDAWDALHALGMLWSARDFARAGTYRRQALELARSIGDASIIARSLNRVANWHVNLDQPAPALRDHVEALTLFEQLDDQRGVAETIDLLAMARYVAGDIAASGRLYVRVIELHEGTGDRRVLASALSLLCACEGSISTASTAFATTAMSRDILASERPVQLAREIGWRAGQSFALFLLAESLAWRGDYDRALPFVRESLAIAEEMDHLQWLSAASCAYGMMLLDIQSPRAARPALERAHAIAVRLASPTWTRWTAAPLAEVLALLGDFEAAHAVLDDAAVPSALGRDALRPGDEDSPTLSQRMLALARAEVALAEGAPAVALDIANERLAAEQDAVPRLLTVRAVALARLDAEKAEAALREACEAAVAHDARPLLWRVQVEKGQLFRRRRQRAEARKAFDEARAVAVELAARIPDVELRRGFESAVEELAPAPPSPSDRQKAKSSFGGLTSRERDVARLVALGKSNRAIGRALGIGERTVETYVSAALSKLGFSTRSQLAAWTVEHGLGDTAPKR